MLLSPRAFYRLPTSGCASASESSCRSLAWPWLSGRSCAMHPAGCRRELGRCQDPKVTDVLFTRRGPSLTTISRASDHRQRSPAGLAQSMDVVRQLGQRVRTHLPSQSRRRQPRLDLQRANRVRLAFQEEPHLLGSPAHSGPVGRQSNQWPISPSDEQEWYVFLVLVRWESLPL